MNILLIRPDHQEFNISNRSLGTIHQPLGLLYLAASLEQAGHQVQICDEIVGDNFHTLIAERRPDLVGITVTTPLFERVCDIIANVSSKEIPVILGGPHVCALPRESVEKSGAQAAVTAEGEETLCDIAAGKEWNEIAGLNYFRNGNWISNPRQQPPDINTLPFPARHLLDRRKYLGEHEIGFFVGKNKNLVRMFTSRGCPFQCTFCSSVTIFGRKARFRSAASVMEELQQGIKDWQTDNVMFMDDTFTLNKNHVHEICEAILSSDLKIRWGCFARADVSEDLLKIMKRAGCHLIGFGVESGSPRILKRLKKNISVPKVEESLRLCRKHGLRSKAFLMVGVPDETREDFQMTVDLCLRAKPDYLSVSIFFPLPGSEILRELPEEEQKRARGNFYQTDSPINKARQIELLRKFHFRPNYFYNFVRNFSFHEIPDYWYMVKAFLAVRRSMA